jgi:hypothetical protein
MCWPSVRSEASGAGDSDQPATALYASVPPARVPQRDRVMAMRLGRVEWHEVLSNTVLDRLQTTIGALIVCHSIRPGQVTMVAGRLIWHRTRSKAMEVGRKSRHISGRPLPFVRRAGITASRPEPPWRASRRQPGEIGGIGPIDTEPVPDAAHRGQGLRWPGRRHSVDQDQGLDPFGRAQGRAKRQETALGVAD